MPGKGHRAPSYRLHKPSGQARVIIDGEHKYLLPNIRVFLYVSLFANETETVRQTAIMLSLSLSGWGLGPFARPVARGEQEPPVDLRLA
jgi:hypothetical protein